MTETASSAAPANASDNHRSAYGFGLATIATSASGGEATVLDVWYPAPSLGVAAESLRDVENADPALTALAEEGKDADRGTEQKVVFAQIDLDAAPPADTADATCVCTSSRTAWSSRTASTWTVSSASCPTLCGPTSAPPPRLTASN